MYAVAGVTGHTGKVVAEALLEQGEPVTVIIRTDSTKGYWRSKGAEVAVADLGDSDALRRILDKVEGAYLLLPPNYGEPKYIEDRQRVADSIAKAVSESRLFHVVFLSSIGGHLDSGTGAVTVVHYLESALMRIANNITLLRPSYFMENWAPVLDIARNSGVLNTFLSPNRKISMTATRDIGRIAAECLQNPAHGRRIIEIAGPEDYSPEEIAVVVGSILHRDIHLEALPLSNAGATFKSVGFSDEAAHLFEEMYSGLNSGRISFERRGAEFRRGRVRANEVLSELLRQQPQSTASATV
jgi:uncharacterized protein YbjT (DUF2867 family)